MTEPQVPRMSDLMTPAIDALVAGLPTEEARRERERHANHGRFADILRGFRGQGEVVRARLTREIIATRLIDVNGGQPLRDLAASEYFARLAEEPTFAIGEIQLRREKASPSSSTSGVFLPGVIPAGRRFTRRKSEPESDFPLDEADFVSTGDVVCSGDANFSPTVTDGGWLHVQLVSVPVRASSPGEHANTPSSYSLVADPRDLFDSAQPLAERFKGGGISSAGGQVGISDDQIRDFAKAMATGFHGANTDGALAGARSDPRVRRVAAAFNYGTAILALFPADTSWSTSAAYRNSVMQGMADRQWIGFGARIGAGRIQNIAVTVRSVVYLRSKLFASEKTAVALAIRDRLTRYFDDRADFYTWNIEAIGGVIASAHPRVLTAGAPQVLHQGYPMSAPATTIAGGASSIPHYSLRGLDLEFADPGS